MEIWKDIPGYVGRYQVSDLGRVRSKDRYVRAVSKRGLEFQRWVQGRVLRPGMCRGYLIVNPYPQPTIAVHLLVARAFVPGEQPGLEVNHIDGDKLNNCASNLEWVTKSENQRHAVRNGLRAQSIAVVDPVSGQIHPSISDAARKVGKAARKWPRA